MKEIVHLNDLEMGKPELRKVGGVEDLMLLDILMDQNPIDWTRVSDANKNEERTWSPLWEGARRRKEMRTWRTLLPE